MSKDPWLTCNYGYCIIAYKIAPERVYYLLDISDKAAFHKLVVAWNGKFRWATTEEFRERECLPIERWKNG